MPHEKPSDPASPVPPSPDALSEKIDALTAHIPNADERAEIAAHLEDLAAAYLTGERRPSPDDALLLARSHLGHAALARRPAALVTTLASAALATLLVTLLFNIVSANVTTPLLRGLGTPYRDTFRVDERTLLAAVVLSILAANAVLAAALAAWNKPMLRSRPARLAAVLLALLLLSLSFVPSAGPHLVPPLPPAVRIPGGLWTFLLAPAWAMVACLAVFCPVFLWLHFTRAAQRSAAALVAIAAGAVLWQELCNVLLRLLHSQGRGVLGMPWSVDILLALRHPATHLLATILALFVHVLLMRPRKIADPVAPPLATA
jgi:hypothetical protein